MSELPIFTIGLIDGEVFHEGHANGRIVLGDFAETFEASLSLWSEEDYQRHWREAVERVVGGADRAALVTSMYDPTTANFIMWWPMYRHDRNVRVQSHMLFMDQLSEPFSLDDVHRSVTAYDQESDGQAVSEWVLPVESLVHWLGAAPHLT